MLDLRLNRGHSARLTTAGSTARSDWPAHIIEDRPAVSGDILEALHGITGREISYGLYIELATGRFMTLAERPN